jgi:hypothetical protein
MNGLAVAAAGVYAATGMAQVLAVGWMWTRPGLLSGLAAGVATAFATVLPWWLLTVLAYTPVSADTAAYAAIGVCVNCALLAGWRSRGGR